MKLATFTSSKSILLVINMLPLAQLSGLWFQVARAHAADDIHWDAGVFHLHIENPSSIRIHFTGRSK